ncbi:Flp pilus assembly protein CpaB [Comamonas sp. Tr-654]|uniref:Flp pilus assembly protein CpaB n=1 Tax=Comamonas sp. Tr-654 TaxID=2608341 RepID=UPI00141E10E2|nr:Flp pilus assembly protein CpaB [Comamonas sp. Tr-654]NIF86063.1 Flp pilus assembly protein CpaB [Comamonas sp. Tr-654]
MKTRPLILLVGAVTLASASALVGRALMRPPPPVTIVKEVPATSPVAPPLRVLAASRLLESGEFIAGNSLTWKELPSDEIDVDQWTGATDTERRRIEREIFGSAIRHPLQAGETLRRPSVVKPGEPGFLSTVLQPGKRAVSIPTTVVTSNAGLVSAGDRVDVILNLNRADLQPPNSQPNSNFNLLAAQTIVHDVRVLALDSHTQGLGPDAIAEETTTEDANKRNPRAAGAPAVQALKRRESATLEVSPAEAERLSLAREAGTLQLALRGVRENPGAGRTSSAAVRLDDVSTVLGAPPSSPVASYRGAAVAYERPAQQP